MDYKIPTRPSPLGVAVGGAREAKKLVPEEPSKLSTMPSTSAAPATEEYREYSLRVPKTNIRPLSIMRFNKSLGVDPGKWSSVKMLREDNSRLHKTNVVIPTDEEMPKFGAGSEYGREAREEARRRKYGISKKKYNPDDQPWLLKVGDKVNRKYKGVKEGGVAENASYFIFTHAPDGAFEVFPVDHWYNFTPIQRYKALTSEEAEQEFGRRNKIMNYFSVMVRRRMKADDDGEEEAVVNLAPSGKKGGKKKAGSDLKVSEMDDWADSEEEEEMSGEEDDDKPKEKKKNAAGKKKPTKKKKGSDDEGLEDSDDGDEEGRELDYISDTSGSEESEPEKEADIKGVDQEEALLHLLESGSEEEEEGEKKKPAEGEGEGGPTVKTEEQTETGDKKKKKKKKKKVEKKEVSDYVSEEEEKDDEHDFRMDLGDALKSEPGDGNSEEPNPNKRKATSELVNMATTSNKKQKLEMSPFLLQTASAEGITEEAVRRYLHRKPMTVTELLHKFKSKKTKIQSQDMVHVVAHILKKINPAKRMQNQKMYLSLAAPK